MVGRVVNVGSIIQIYFLQANYPNNTYLALLGPPLLGADLVLVQFP